MATINMPDAELTTNPTVSQPTTKSVAVVIQPSVSNLSDGIIEDCSDDDIDIDKKTSIDKVRPQISYIPHINGFILRILYNVHFFRSTCVPHTTLRVQYKHIPVDQ